MTTKMIRIVYDYFFLVLAFAAVITGYDNSEEESAETEHVAYHNHYLASSPDANLVYENSYFFEIVTPESLSYTYKLRQAKDFGTDFNRLYNGVKLVMAEPEEACRPVSSSVLNKVVMVLRGGCSFMTKSIHVQEAGALAVIIADNNQNNDDHMIDMINDETGRAVAIPAMFLMGKDGVMIRRYLAMEGLKEAVINIPLNLTSMALGTAKQPPWTLW